MKVQFLVEPHVGVVHDMPEDAAQKAIESGAARAHVEPSAKPAESASEALPSEAMAPASPRRSFLRGGRKE